jgi:hypothetical protein
MVAAGCNATEGPPESRRFSDVYLETFCELSLECCATDELTRLPSVDAPYENVESCLDQLQPEIDSIFPLGARAGIDSGRIVLDEVRANRCLRSYRERGCAADRRGTDPAIFLERDADCRDVWSGQVDVGQPCARTLECFGDAVCRDGFCLPPAQPGDPCRAGVCSPGSRCDDRDDERVCVPRGELGAACDEDLACASFFCDPEAGVCTEYPESPWCR